MIKTINNNDGTWMVWNQKTNMVADIVTIREYGYLATNKKRYRVDVNGQTVASMIDHFATAKSVATKKVK